MKLKKSALYWIAWLLASCVLGSWLAYAMLSSDTDKSIFMPGALSPGHHQLVDSCEACHTDALGGGKVLQTACVECHGKDRVKPFDSHPAKKFKDPRNADLMAKINALQCVSCHTEHRPEITAKNGLTQPADVCAHCHQAIAKDRPSHAGMGFDTCRSSGCHNFHNNRALYTDFLIKHLHEAPVLANAVVPSKEFLARLEEDMEYPHAQYPVKALAEDDIDAPGRVTSEILKKEWLETAHAAAGVNCSACHVKESAEDSRASWDDNPDYSACTSCHSVEVGRFMQGRHGMRLKQGLSPMTPATALLPMKQEASHKQLTCSSCHEAHLFNVKAAAVESCLECHDDSHSQAYKSSPHYQLWQEELAGAAKPGSGVSCATCHMPRVEHDINDWFSRVMVDHNQSANFSPNSKMIRSSCLHCHGLGYTLDALADEDLIETNFRGQPSVHVNSMELAEKDQKRRQQDAEKQDDDENMFGF